MRPESNAVGAEVDHQSARRSNASFPEEDGCREHQYRRVYEECDGQSYDRVNGVKAESAPDGWLVLLQLAALH